MKDKLKEILEATFQLEGKVEIQYVDYDKNTWSVPMNINQERMNNILNDGSVKRVRITIEPKHIR